MIQNFVWGLVSRYVKIEISQMCGFMQSSIEQVRSQTTVAVILLKWDRTQRKSDYFVYLTFATSTLLYTDGPLRWAWFSLPLARVSVLHFKKCISVFILFSYEFKYSFVPKIWHYFIVCVFFKVPFFLFRWISSSLSLSLEK